MIHQRERQDWSAYSEYSQSIQKCSNKINWKNMVITSHHTVLYLYILDTIMLCVGTIQNLFPLFYLSHILPILAEGGNTDGGTEIVSGNLKQQYQNTLISLAKSNIWK